MGLSGFPPILGGWVGVHGLRYVVAHGGAATWHMEAQTCFALPFCHGRKRMAVLADHQGSSQRSP